LQLASSQLELDSRTALSLARSTFKKRRPLSAGDEFHAQLVSTFTFRDELHASRQAKKTQIIKMPPLIPPRCSFKVF
jgi:hypothetical protein